MNNTTQYNRLIKKDNPFTQILNSIITDTRISSNAFRLLSYLISKPNDWIINLTEAYATLGLGRDAGARAFKDLEAVGYLTRTQVRGEKGIIGYNYILNETVAGFLETRNAATTNTKSTNTEEDKILKEILDIYKESNYVNRTKKAKAYLEYELDEVNFNKLLDILKQSKTPSELNSNLNNLKIDLKVQSKTISKPSSRINSCFDPDDIEFRNISNEDEDEDQDTEIEIKKPVINEVEQSLNGIPMYIYDENIGKVFNPLYRQEYAKTRNI